MPELPEVETTRRGIAPFVVNHAVVRVVVRQPQLRWPVPSNLPQLLQGQLVRDLRRRAKYLLMQFAHGTLLLHLGMSGSLRIVERQCAAQKHDHIDIEFDNGRMLRFTDPRRFGAVLWTESAPTLHPLLVDLGPEPLSDAFDGDYLFQRSRKRQQAVKNFIMDGHIVVGVGNIYANEALFQAGIRPSKRAGKVTQDQYQRLAQAIKDVLMQAITAGGTTLRDFVGGDGRPGYFAQSLFVYGRDGEACRRCQSLLKQRRIGQRASVYCPQCQK